MRSPVIKNIRYSLTTLYIRLSTLHTLNEPMVQRLYNPKYFLNFVVCLGKLVQSVGKLGCLQVVVTLV